MEPLYFQNENVTETNYWEIISRLYAQYVEIMQLIGSRFEILLQTVTFIFLLQFPFVVVSKGSDWKIIFLVKLFQ